MNKTRMTGKLRLERETLRTLCSDTLEGVGGGMAVPWTFTCPPRDNPVAGGTLGDFTKPQPVPAPVPGGKLTDVLTKPRLGTCFCPPGVQ